MKNMTSCLLAMFVMAVAPVASAVIINVPGDYATIQEGIDAVQDGDTVLVAAGEYVENLLIEDKNVFLTSAEGPETVTIVGYLIFEGNIDTTCVLQGFTVTRYSENTEALIRCLNGSLSILGNVITGNGPVGTEGGIRILESEAIIKDNIIRGNFSTVLYGGGLYIQNSSTIVSGNLIYGNYAGNPYDGYGGLGIGGGIYAAYSNVNLDRNVISFNTANDGGLALGGGIHVANCNVEIINNTIVQNSARALHYGSYGLGGGINISSSEVTITNSILWGNQGEDYSEIVDDDIHGEATVTYSDIGEGYEGEGNISLDPLLVDPSGHDYHLLLNSPCIDAGDPNSPYDPDSTRSDMGVYYFDQTTDVYNPGQPSGPYQFQLHQNYPNPFNSQTIISYYLTEESVVSLHIYSITGHFVTAITNKERQNSGEHKYVWDGKDKNDRMVSTGIYFYELYVDDYRESKAMIMIK